MFSQFSTDQYRWIALVFLSLGLAIVIIDNTVLNVAIPYILRDLKTSFNAIQWVVSGYALIIATLLITVGRMGDLIGRKKIFLFGCVLFAIGSFIASISWNVYVLFFGEAFIEAVGAAMMLTSTLALLASEFHGKERALAFGVWGSVAGASATIGPLLGGYLTANYSWRWSLRINVLVALIAIMGSVFIKESKGVGEKRYDWVGTFLSGFGLFSLVFGFIEGATYGWWHVVSRFTVFGWVWPFSLSVIPVSFLTAFLFLGTFVWYERYLEKKGASPLVKMSIFTHRGFSLGLATLGIVVLGQFGAFFVLPIYLQNVLGMDAFMTGIVFLPVSLAILLFGPLSGFIASKIGPKWVVNTGMLFAVAGTYLLTSALSLHATIWSLAPALSIFGIGIGMTSAQLTNIILSAVPVAMAGEASAVNATFRQVGTSIGIAIIGVVLAGSLTANIYANVVSDFQIPSGLRIREANLLEHISVESGQKGNALSQHNLLVANAVKYDINSAIVAASKDAMQVGLWFVVLGAIVSFFIPVVKVISWEQRNKQKE